MILGPNDGPNDLVRNDLVRNDLVRCAASRSDRLGELSIGAVRRCFLLFSASCSTVSALWDAAVFAVGRAVGDARHDEFHQSGALQLCHAWRLRGSVALMTRYGWPFFATLPFCASHRRSRWSCRRLRAAVLSPPLPGEPSRSGAAADDRHRLYLGGGGGLRVRHLRAEAAAVAGIFGAARFYLSRSALRRLSAVHDRHRAGDHGASSGY